MDNFNCKQHLKCGEWKKNPNPFAISKGSIAHETKQKCHRKYAIERKPHRHAKFWRNRANDNSSNLQLLNMMSANNLRACESRSLMFIFIVDNCFFFIQSSQSALCKYALIFSSSAIFCSLFGQSWADEQLSTEIQKYHDSFCIWYYKGIHFSSLMKQINAS